MGAVTVLVWGRRMGYKSSDLIREANRQGYSFLNPTYFKKLVQRGVFPRGHRITKPSGQVYRDREWGDRDMVRLLDMCFLHGLNARSDPIKLGLWLLGHPVEEARTLLVEQLERIQVVLMGKAHKRGESLDDEAVEHINSVLEQSSVLGDVSYGLDHDVHDEDIDDAVDLHPDRCNGASREMLRAFSHPIRTGEGREFQARLGGEVYEWIEYEYAYPNPAIHPKQLNHLQHTAIIKRLGDLLDLADALTDTLKLADMPELEQGRFLMEVNTIHLLHEYSAIPYHVRDKRLDLRQLLEPYKGNVRYLIASPKLFPFTTLMVATHVIGRHTTMPISFNMGLLALALDRLLKCKGALNDTQDALLTLVFAVCPEPDGVRSATLA
jgi:hypothetical protein